MSKLTALALFTATLGSAAFMAPAAHAHEQHVVNNSIHSAPACREFVQKVTIGGRTKTAYGTACQTRSGDWRIVSNNSRPGKRFEGKHHRHHPHHQQVSYNQRSLNTIVWNEPARGPRW